MFRLDLVPGNPMAYRLGDEVHDIEAVEIQVEIPEGMAARTVHMTHLGPVVAGQGTPWTDENVYVIRDVNYENYRSSDQYRDISNARNVEELRSALATHQVQHSSIPSQRIVMACALCRYVCDSQCLR